jgi:hypothetical protein
MWLLIAALAWFSPAVSGTPQSAAVSRDTPACEVTHPNGRFVSDEVRVGAGLPRSPFLHGNDSVATALWADGTVVFRSGGPGAVLPDGSLRMKFLWLKIPRPLRVEGRRLDAAAPPLRAEIAAGFDDAVFQPSWLIFPAVGCWEVTARVADDALTFVTRVERKG